MKIQIPIVKPIPIFKTVDTTRPINAPLATRVASPAERDRLDTLVGERNVICEDSRNDPSDRQQQPQLSGD